MKVFERVLVFGGLMFMVIGLFCHPYLDIPLEAAIHMTITGFVAVFVGGLLSMP